MKSHSCWRFKAILAMGLFIVVTMARPVSASIEWPEIDVAIEERDPTTNFCGDVNNRIEYSVERKRIRTLIGGIDAQVSQADRDTLHIRNGGGTTGGTHRINAYLITSSWNECTVTWSSQPSYDLGVNGEFKGSLDSYWKGDGWWFAIPITEIVRAWRNGRSNYGIMLEVTPVDHPDAALTFKNEENNQGPNVTYGGQVYAPDACFTANPESGPAPLTVSFTNCTQDAYLYNWEFGDGGQFFDQNPPPHTYTSPGTYSVWLTAQNDDESDRVKKTITVRPPDDPPICTVSPLTLPFGEVYISDCSSKTFTITNTGKGTLSGSVSESCTRFSITNPNPPNYSLGAGQSQTFTVEFCPGEEMSYQCTIETGTNCEDTKNVIASGTGIKRPYVHPFKIEFNSIQIGERAYTSPTNLPEGIEVGKSVTLRCTLRDATGKTVPGGSPGDTLVVFDFLQPYPTCPVPPAIGTDGKFEYRTTVGNPANSNFRGVFIRTAAPHFEDLPILLSLYLDIPNSINLLRQSYLDSLSESMKSEFVYDDTRFERLTSIDEQGYPHYVPNIEHQSEVIEPEEWLDLATPNTFPTLIQIFSWYEGAGTDVFGPHLEITDMCEDLSEQESSNALLTSPIRPIITKTGMFIGFSALCALPPVGPVTYAKAVGCILRVATGTEIVEDVLLAINSLTNDSGTEIRATAIEQADLIEVMSFRKKKVRQYLLGEAIELFDENILHEDTRWNMDMYEEAKEAKRTGDYPFTNCTIVRQIETPLGFDYEYHFYYKGEEFYLRGVDPDTSVSIETPSPPASHFTSLEILPNPFNPEARVEFVTEVEGRCTLEVYDLAGAKVIDLIDGTIDAGRHSVTWDGKDANGKAVASGTYLFRLETPTETLTRRAVLLK